MSVLHALLAAIWCAAVPCAAVGHVQVPTLARAVAFAGTLRSEVDDDDVISFHVDVDRVFAGEVAPQVRFFDPFIVRIDANDLRHLPVVPAAGRRYVVLVSPTPAPLREVRRSDLLAMVAVDETEQERKERTACAGADRTLDNPALNAVATSFPLEVANERQLDEAAAALVRATAAGSLSKLDMMRLAGRPDRVRTHRFPDGREGWEMAYLVRAPALRVSKSDPKGPSQTTSVPCLYVYGAGGRVEHIVREFWTSTFFAAPLDDEVAGSIDRAATTAATNASRCSTKTPTTTRSAESSPTGWNRERGRHSAFKSDAPLLAPRQPLNVLSHIKVPVFSPPQSASSETPGRRFHPHRGTLRIAPRSIRLLMNVDRQR